MLNRQIVDCLFDPGRETGITRRNSVRSNNSTVVIIAGFILKGVLKSKDNCSVQVVL